MSDTWQSLIDDTCHSLIGPLMSLLTHAGLHMSSFTRVGLHMSSFIRFGLHMSSLTCVDV